MQDVYRQIEYFRSFLPSSAAKNNTIENCGKIFVFTTSQKNVQNATMRSADYHRWCTVVDGL